VGTRSILKDGPENMRIWINRPSFLHQVELEFFDDVLRKPSEVVLFAFRSEEVNHGPQQSALFNLVNHYSNWSHLLRAVVWMTRFKRLLHCLFDKEKMHFEKISVEELASAEIDVIWLVQANCFSYLIKYFNSGKVVSEYKNELKSIQKLSPLLDEQGIIRVRGRLQRSADKFDLKHLILLPKCNNVTRLIIVYCHKRLRHSGYNSVLARIRQRFWIVSGISTVRYYLKDCFFCSYWWASVGQQQMVPLPQERITSGGIPFQITGVDFLVDSSLFLLVLANLQQQNRSSSMVAYLHALPLVLFI